MGARARIATCRSRLEREERGSALVIALGVLLVLSVAVASSTAYTGARSRNAHVQVRQQSAQALAEAGVNEAAAVLANAGDPTSPGALTVGSDTFQTGSAAWT